ncbi:hypothetical protein ACKFKF_06595 [Phormidesmis sp. 146-12]
MKIKLNPATRVALATALLLLGLWLVLRRFQIQVEVTSPETVPIIKIDESQNEIQKTPPKPGASPIPTLNPAMVAARQGALRVSNRSDHPLRVALLSKSKSSAPQSSEASDYQPPAHWDFAPNEGSGKGLVVSLPDRSIILKKGDVVVAFAQDGSQRYWGPFVVGETNSPIWNGQEWELILKQ